MRVADPLMSVLVFDRFWFSDRLSTQHPPQMNDTQIEAKATHNCTGSVDTYMVAIVRTVTVPIKTRST